MIENWPLVTIKDPGIRPAGEPDRCFYCHQKIGQPHGQECVIVQKKVKVRYSFEIDIDVPHHWSKETIEFHRNESSWCADNAIREIRRARGPHCWCNRFRAEFVGNMDLTPKTKG